MKSDKIRATMKMNNDFQRSLWYVLEKIMSRLQISDNICEINYQIELIVDPDNPQPLLAEQEEVIKLLTTSGAIQESTSKEIEYFESNGWRESISVTYHFHINKQKFSDIYEKQKNLQESDQQLQPIEDESEKVYRVDNWELRIDDKKAYIYNLGEKIYTFPTNWSDKFRYFWCLWLNHNKLVDYKDMYEYESKTKYPDKKGDNWIINRGIRQTVNKLRNELSEKSSLIQIQTNKGYKLTLQSKD